MNIAYQGHALFSLTADCGFTVCCDPYDDSVGYPVPSLHADAVTISHDHHDHNHVRALKGVLTRCDEVRTYDLPGAKIAGYAAWHDSDSGKKRGPNRMYAIEMDGVRVLHLGDLGHMLSDETVEAIGRVDVLLVPVGGYYTIDAETAAALTRRIAPAIAIPMHYRTEASKRLPIETQGPYLERMGVADEAPLSRLAVCAGDLPKATRVVWLRYA
ncbi:MAG TPA: MBL fold metallo-hydrolase [Clostridia bacterium]|nr:MBL fold metallo-hydrolase [Clostridia bacterium]